MGDKKDGTASSAALLALLGADLQVRLREAAGAVSIYSLLRGMECLVKHQQQQVNRGGNVNAIKSALFTIMRLVVRTSIQWPPSHPRSCDDIFRESNEALSRAAAALQCSIEAGAEDSASSALIAAVAAQLQQQLATTLEQCLDSLSEFTRHCSGEALITWVTSRNTADSAPPSEMSSPTTAAAAATPQQQHHHQSAARHDVDVCRDFAFAVQSIATATPSSHVRTGGPGAGSVATDDGAAAAAASSSSASAPRSVSPGCNVNSQQPTQQRRRQQQQQQYAAAVSASLEHHSGVVLPYALHVRSSWERAAQDRNCGGEAVVAMRMQRAAKMLWGPFATAAETHPQSAQTTTKTATASNMSNKTQTNPHNVVVVVDDALVIAAAPAAAAAAVAATTTSPPASPLSPALTADQANLWRSLHLLPTAAELDRGGGGGLGSRALDSSLAPFVARSGGGGGGGVGGLIYGNVAERRRVHAHAAICALTRARKALLRGEFGIARSSVAIAAAQHAPSCGSTEILLAALTLKMHVEFLTGCARDGCQTVGVVLDSVVDALRSSAASSSSSSSSRSSGGSGPPVLRPPNISALMYLLTAVTAAVEALLFAPQAVEESLLRRLLFVLSCVFAADGFSASAAASAAAAAAAASAAAGVGDGGGAAGGHATARTAITAADASDFIDATLTRHVVDNAAVAPSSSSSSKSGANAASAAAAPSSLSSSSAAACASPFVPMMTPSIVRLMWRRLYHFAEALILSTFSQRSAMQPHPDSVEYRMQEMLLALSLFAEARYGDILHGGSISKALFDDESRNNDNSGAQPMPTPPAGINKPTQATTAASSSSSSSSAPAQHPDTTKDHERIDTATAVTTTTTIRAQQQPQQQQQQQQSATTPASLLLSVCTFQCRPAVAIALILSEYYKKGPLSAVRAFDRLSSVLLIDSAAPLSWVALQRAVALVCAAALHDKGYSRSAAAWLQSSITDRKQQTNRSGCAPAGAVSDHVDAASLSLLAPSSDGDHGSSSSSLVGAAFWGLDAELHSQLCLALSRTLCWSLESAHLVESLCLDPLRQQLSGGSISDASASSTVEGSGGSAALNNGTTTNDSVEVAVTAERLKAAQLFSLGRPSMALAALEQAAATCLALGWDTRACELIAEAYIGAASLGDWESACAWRCGSGTASAVSSSSSSSSSQQQQTAFPLRLKGPWRSFLCRLSLRKMCDVLLAATTMLALPLSESGEEEEEGNHSNNNSHNSIDAELAAAEATALWNDAATAAPALFAEACTSISTALSARIVGQSAPASSVFHGAASAFLNNNDRVASNAKLKIQLVVADAVPLPSVAGWVSSLATLFSARASSSVVVGNFLIMMWNALFPSSTPPLTPTATASATAVTDSEIDALLSVFDELVAEMNARRDATTTTTSAATRLDALVHSSMSEQVHFILRM